MWRWITLEYHFTLHSGIMSWLRYNKCILWQKEYMSTGQATCQGTCIFLLFLSLSNVSLSLVPSLSLSMCTMVDPLQTSGPVFDSASHENTVAYPPGLKPLPEWVRARFTLCVSTLCLSALNTPLLSFKKKHLKKGLGHTISRAASSLSRNTRSCTRSVPRGTRGHLRHQRRNS